MALQQRQASVFWIGDINGKGTVTVGSGALPPFPVDFAARTEAPGGKTSPEELIAAAHATCYAMAFSNALAKAGNPPERLNIQATCSLDRTEAGLKITSMDLDVRGRVAGLDQARFQELATLAEQACPVSNALRNNVHVTVKAKLES